MAERSVVVRIRAEIGDFRRQMQQASEATAGLGRTTQTAGQQMSTAMTQTQAQAAAARVALRNAGQAAQESARGFGLSYNSAGQLTDQFGALVTEAHAAELGLDTVSDATREFAAQQANAAAQAAQASTTMGRLAASARDHEEAWSTAGTSLLTFGAAVTAGVGLAIAKYAEFDKAMSEVRAATHASAADMGLLREAAIVAGADTSYSATEAANAITELSKAGVDTADILKGGLTGALNLAAAGSMDVAKAAELAATAMTQFQLGGDDIPHIADLLAAGAGKAQGSVEDLGMALKQGGLLASSTGLSIEETTGGLAAFAKAGLLGSDAGTSFKTMLQSLTPNSVAAANEMERLGFNAVNADGSFKSLKDIAGNLRSSMQGLTDAQRAQSMEIIFGSDAVRAANVLYENGAEGIDEWTRAVNVAGYAAITAGMKQDNLAGDLEKLGGSFDTVLIKGGGGAAQALRGVVSGAEDLIDALGQVDPELLSLAVGLAGVVGGTALLAGGFLTLFPKAMAVHTAFKTLQSTNAGLAGGLGKVAKGAGIAGAALAAMSIAGAMLSDKSTKTASDYANAILKVANAGSAAKSADLDSIFQGFDKFGGQDTVNGINSTADAIERLANPTWEQNVDKFFDGFANGILNLPKSDLGQLEDRLKGVGDELGNIVKNGGAEAAAKSFRLLTDEFKANGKSAQDALDAMPGYKDALLQQASALGVNLEPAQLLELAQGRVPGVMSAAQVATENKAAADEAARAATQAQADALEDLGLNLDGTINSLAKYTEALFAAGLIEMDARSATAAHEAALDNTKAAVEEATEALAKEYEAQGLGAEAAKAQAEAQMGLGVALNKNKTDFDTTTAAGRILNEQFQSVAKTGMAEIEAKAKAGVGQPELQKNLVTSFNQLKKTGEGMGLTAGAADALARKVMGIPPKANINTWMSDEAKRMAEATDKAIRDLDGKTAHTYVIHHEKNVIENVTTSSASVHNNTGGKQGTKPTFHADGGAIHGPGSGTSDEVPAWLSNGEHVLTAEEVRKMGGQMAVYRFRQAVMSGGVPKFATGGSVTWGQVSAARWKQLIAQGWHGRPGDKVERLYEPTAAEIKKRMADVEKARKKREAELKKSAQYRAEQAAELGLDDIRGESWRSVKNLSSGYAFSDKLRSVATSGNVPSQRGALLWKAHLSDIELRKLQTRADGLAKSLDTAKSKLEELQSVRKGVANGLSGEFKLSDAVKSATFYGKGTVGGIQSYANGVLARIQKFGGKLNALQKKGYSGAIVQEIAGMGSEEGSKAADILLAGSAAEVKALNNTYTAIDKASDAAGVYVTNAMYKGGVNAAAGLVKGLESQQKAVEAQMMKIGLGMEKALKTALGIKSPSRKAIAIAQNVTGTLADNLKLGQAAVEAEALALGAAMLPPVPSKSMAGGYGTNLAVRGTESRMPALAGAGAGGTTINHWTITDQSNPVATAHEVARRQQSLEV